jgi:two-component sensor histidine kinase
MNVDNPTLTIENRVVVNGEVRWTQWINRMLFDEQGQLVEFQAVGRDITDRKQVEEQLQASLREKEVLLKEIHHRVKNNLQIVYSLLRLQRRKLKDQVAANALLESQNRIESIALIHEKLYQSKDLARINLAEYVDSLVTNLFSIYNANHNQIALKTEIEPIFLDMDKAISCGLIVNELLSNALKYAFPPGNHQNNPSISVKFSAEPEESTISLVIQDNGVGIPNHVDFSNLETLGLQLVQGLVNQLKATLKMHCQDGTEFQIVFPRAVV